MSKLIYRYQTVIHSVKDAILVHECLANDTTGQLYALNPTPVTVKRDNAKSIEKDSLKYLPVKIESLTREIGCWHEEMELDCEQPLPFFEDEEELDDDYYDESGEVLDLVDYMKRNK